MNNTDKYVISREEWNQIRKDKEFSRSIGIYLLLNEFNAILQNTFGVTGPALSVLRIVIMLIIFGIFFRCIIHFNKEESSSIFLILCAALFLFAYSWACGSQVSSLVDWGITTIGICIPLGVFAYSVKDRNVLYSELYKFSYPVFGLLLINLMGSENLRYDMHFSYMLLYVMIFHLSYMLKNKKYILIPVILFEILILLAYGSRGAIACIGAYLILRILTKIKNVVHIVVYSLLVIIAAFGAQYSIDRYGKVLLEKLQSMGFDARTLRLLLRGTFSSHDSGRSDLWQLTMDFIKQKPVFGWGIHGASQQLGTPYPHQLFLDLWLSFGVILGTAIAILIVISLRKVLLCDNAVVKDMNQMFFSMAFVSLMFSGTLFTSYYFFIMMGLLLNKSQIDSEKTVYAIDADHGGKI